jgi:exosome complex component RRP42
MPSVPAIPILAPTKCVLYCPDGGSLLTVRYFVPNLHLTLLSNSGFPLSALVLAARAAFMDLRIPSTKRIGWEESETISFDGMKDSDLSGIKSAVKAGRTGGKGKGKAAVKGDEWDLDLTTAGGRGVEWLVGRENLPVLVTLHLVCFQCP